MDTFVICFVFGFLPLCVDAYIVFYEQPKRLGLWWWKKKPNAEAE